MISKRSIMSSFLCISLRIHNGSIAMDLRFDCFNLISFKCRVENTISKDSESFLNLGFINKNCKVCNFSCCSNFHLWAQSVQCLLDISPWFWFRTLNNDKSTLVASLATNWFTELFATDYCLLPTLTATVILNNFNFTQLDGQHKIRLQLWLHWIACGKWKALNIEELLEFAHMGALQNQSIFFWWIVDLHELPLFYFDFYLL